MDISTWKNLSGLSSTPTQSLHNYGNTLDINSALYNWQYLTAITITNGMSSSPLTRLHQQQQYHPLRYIQINKSPRSQYNSQTQIASHQQQQSQQYNYPQQYSLISTNIQQDNLINVQKYENIPAISYFANQLNSKSSILAHNFNTKSFDEQQFNYQTNGVSYEIEQPKYVISNGHLVSPGELSLTTCFTLTNWFEQLYPTIIRTDSMHDYLPLPTPSQSVYNYYRDYSTLGFINIVEAVPDILKNIRPENFIFTSTLISVSIGRNEKLSQRSATNLIKQLQRPLTNKSEYSIAINPYWSVLLKTTRTKNNLPNKTTEYLELENNLLIQNNGDYKLKIIDEQLNNNYLSNQKTYADVLQDNTKDDCAKMKVIKGLYEINSITEAISGPQKRIIDSLNSQNEDNVISNNEECEELSKSTADFIARAARRTTRVSSIDSGISVDEVSDDIYKLKNEIKKIDEKKCFNKMAEDFCFGPLVKTPFLLVFDEYNKYRKRMEYTKLFIGQINNGDFNNINDNANICIMNLLNGMKKSNNGINSAVSYRHHYYNHNYQHCYNYNHSWQSQQQWKRDNNYLSRRSLNRI